MKSVLAIATTLLMWSCLPGISSAADKPGRLSIYGQSWKSPHGFEPRALTERERELIREILAAGADFQALYVPDVVTGNVDALDQVGAKFGHFYVICDSPEVSRAVRPLCDELGLPLGLSLRKKTGTGGDQIAAWQGCLQIRRLTVMSPHMNPADLVGLMDYPALETLQLGWSSLRWGTGLTWASRSAPPLATITNDVVIALSRIGSLRRVLLLDCPVKATNFDRLRNVHSLWIQNSELSPDTLASCGRLSKLAELDLTGSVLTQEAVIDFSELQNVKTLGLPQASPQLQETLRLFSGLNELPQLEALFFSKQHGDTWPDLSVIPAQVQRIGFYEVVLDGVSDLGFADARLQAHRALFQRESDTGSFRLTEMQDSRDANRRGCRLVGRQVETIRLRGQEHEPTDFRIVRFPHWTVETGFAHDATTSTLEFSDFTPQQQQAARHLRRLDLFVGPEPMGGGFFAGERAEVYLRWRQPLALPGDAADAVDWLAQVPLQKLVITTDEFPLERLAELKQIKTLTSFELRRDGLTDVHLAILGMWNQLESLTIISPKATFSQEGLEQLRQSLPKSDLDVSDGSGQPLLWRKRPIGRPAGPPTTF